MAFLQKYLQQLWNTVVLVALILCTGVLVQARWQYQDNQFRDDLEVPAAVTFVTEIQLLQEQSFNLLQFLSLCCCS